MMRARIPQESRPLIMHVLFRFDVGGLENGVMNLINRLPTERWRHAIVALDQVNASYFSRIQRDDVLQVSLHKPPGHAAKIYPALYRLFREHRPAIVHTRNLAALEATGPAWAAGVPLRVHGEHGRDMTDLDGSKIKYQLLRRAFRPLVQHYVVMSQDLERYLNRKVGVPAKKISQIYSGVDTTRFQPRNGSRPYIADCPFLDERLWMFGTVGRMQAEKDQTTLAAAFASAVKQDPGAAARLRLVMVGAGALLKDVERILTQAGVRHLAWLPGERTDIPEIMRGLDCFVLPSLAEGISNTILEAMASGLPIVATRVGGNAELVAEGVTGRLVPAGDTQGLAHAVLGYFHAPGLAEDHGRAGRHVAEQRFSLDRMVRDYDNLYLRLLSRYACAQPPRDVCEQQPGQQDRV